MLRSPFYARREAPGAEVPQRRELPQGPNRGATFEPPRAVAAQTAAETVAQGDARMRAQNYAMLLTSGKLPVTSIGAVFNGADINTTSKYLPLFKNTLGRVIAVRIISDFSPAGGGVFLSFSQELSNQQLVEALSAAGKVISDDILMPVESVLYINTADTGIDQTGSFFRVQLLDPVAVFGPGILP